MPPRLNYSSFGRTRAHARANLALYGTIGLCGTTSLLSYDARSSLWQAAQKNDEAGWKRGLERYADLQRHYVCSRANLAEGRYYTLVSSIWNHGGGLHFIGNMVGLWSFGQVIAHGFGAGTFLAVFYGGGIVGNLLCLALDTRDKKGSLSSGDDEEEKLRRQQNRDTGSFIGASGGVCAITAANACLNPWGSMIIGIMFIPVPVPNLFGALGFAGFSAWAQTNDFEESVAHLGHLGGLFYGFLWYVARFKSLPLMV